MRKKYKAIEAISLALATAFISIQCTNAINTVASPLDITGDYHDKYRIHTNSNADHDRDNTGEDKQKHGEWIIIREPTLDEDGLKKREHFLSDGTVRVEYEIIPRLRPEPMPSPTEPATDDRSTEFIEPTASSEQTEPKTSVEPTSTTADIRDDSETKQNKKKHHGGGTAKKSVERNDNVKEETEPSVKDSEISNDDTAATVKETVSDTAVEKEKQVNTEKAKFRAVKGDSGKARVGSDNNTSDSNVESLMTEVRESTKEISYNIESKAESTEASTQSKQKFEIDINAKRHVSGDTSFNRYDGVTLLATGAYTWWIAIVLLPMINAVKWINKKRREKLRSNVNKKHN